MATDATGTPTTKFSIPKYNTSVDAPSGLGNASQMDAIDAVIATLGIAGLVANDVPVYDSVAGKFKKAGGAHTGTNFLRDDGTWATPGGASSGAVTNVNLGAANTDLAGPGANILSYWSASTGGGTLRSIGAPTTAGSKITLKNGSANFITLKHALAGGTGAQLSIINAGDKFLAPGQSIELMYDGTNWVEINRPSQELIADLTLGASQASFDTNTILSGNIPAVYSHLKLVLLLREDDAIVLTNALLRINNDSGASYNLSNVQGNNNAAAASQNGGGTSHNDILSLGASATASKFAATDLLFYSYASATPQKVHTGTSYADGDNTAANLMTRALGGTWRATSAITRLTVLPNSGNFVAGSRFSLYGIT